MLLVYGGGSIKRNGAYDDVTAALREAGNEVVELSGVTPNPRLDKVLEGVTLVREHGVNLILAVAGGSVIDCAKFISLGSGLGEDEDLWDGYVETGKPAPENLVPLGVVLTIAATGSEMGDVAVLTNWARNRKLGYTSFPLTPKFSVLDPTYLLTLPAEQTTYGFVDMFCHTCEQYFSLPSDDNLSDEMVEAIQRHILRSWRACRRHPRSYEARSNAMWDSTLALNRVISRGKEEDWVTHGIEHALSAYFDIPHGAGLAVVHPHWMKYVYTSRPEATARFARWAVNVWGVDSTGKSEREVAEDLGALIGNDPGHHRENADGAEGNDEGHHAVNDAIEGTDKVLCELAFFTGSKDEFVDMFRIVKGGMDELSADLQAKAVGVRTFPTGFEALVKTEDIGSFTALDIEPATIDEIVVFTSKKGEDYE